MSTVSNIIQQLSQTSSRNQKLAILEQNANNQILRRAFECALNPFIQYWIKNVPAKVSQLDPAQSLDWGLDQLTLLADRTYTGHAGLSHLDSIIQSLEKEDAAIIQMIVHHRDLRCGVSDKTVNRVWKGLISEFPAMKCSKNDPRLLKKMNYPAIVQKKEDGARLIITAAADRTIGYFARSGRELSEHFGPVFNDIVMNLLEKYPAGFALDGELLSRGSNRQTGNGLMTKAIRNTITRDEVETLYFVAWDFIPIDDFWNGKSTMPYSDRYEQLDSLLSNIDTDLLQLVYTRVVDNLEQAELIFGQMLNEGFEGIILKDQSGIFEGNKRVRHQIKFKAEETVELRITDLVEGTGKNSGRLGAFRMQSDDCQIIVNVGTGISDMQRKEYWDNPHDVLGQIGEVQYNSVIQNKTDDQVYSLFLPVFKRIRADKTVTNSVADIA